MENNINKYYVYVHRRLTDNLPFYVGKGSGNRAWRTDNRNKYWINTSNKHGYLVEIVFDELDEETAFQCEIDTILEFGYFGYPLTNMTSGGEGVSGYVPTESHINNARTSRMNSQKWWDGNKRAADKLRGRPQKEEHKRAISEATMGKVLTKETKLKMSISKKSDAKAMEHIRRISDKCRDITIYHFIHKDGELFVGNRKEFYIYTNIPQKEINKLFQKKSRKTVYKWSLVAIEAK